MGEAAQRHERHKGNMMASDARQEEIREIRKTYSWFYPLVLGFTVLFIGIWIGATVFVDTDSYGMNLFTELLGIGATVFIIDRIYAYRDRENLKRRLVREVGSGSNEFAKNAASRLRAEGWLTGENGLLKGEHLRRANLKDANLENANLEKSDLMSAELKDAELYFAKLRRAKLLHSKLQGAKFFKADLTQAVLFNADLTGASMLGANLSGTVFMEATMPDGEKYYDGMDLRKYREFDQDTLNMINAIRLGDGLNPITGIDDITDSLPMPTPVRLW